MGKDFFYVSFVQQTHHQPAPHPLPKPAQTCAFLPVSAASQPPCLTAGSRPATLRCHVGGGGRRGVSPHTIPHCAPPSNIIIDHGQPERWKAIPLLHASCETPAANLAALDPRLGLPSRSFVVGSLAAAPPTGPLPVKRCRPEQPPSRLHDTASAFPASHG
jgi:hypothetical protein